jgi:hypothetical protein
VDDPGFRARISRIDATQATRMTGVSWRAGCPVPLRDLRLLTLSHRRFDNRVGTGRLIVHADVARDVVAVFRRLYRERFPIRRMVPVDAYGGSDFRSIERLYFARLTGKSRLCRAQCARSVERMVRSVVVARGREPLSMRVEVALR